MDARSDDFADYALKPVIAAESHTRAIGGRCSGPGRSVDLRLRCIVTLPQTPVGRTSDSPDLDGALFKALGDIDAPPGQSRLSDPNDLLTRGHG